MDNLNKYTKYFLKGKLTEEKELELLNWVKASKENRKLFLLEQERQSNLIASENKQPLLQVLNKLKFPHNRQVYVRTASIAAAFIFGIVLSSVFLNRNEAMFQQNISVPYGAKTNITLPDGSFVWLNSGSTLSYSSKFGKVRPVTLTGEAFFEVKKNKKPFVVKTLYGDVEVKGTSFNVEAFANEMLKTTLVSGSVLVREKDSRKNVVLTPNQQVQIKNSQFEVAFVETDLFTSWKDGKLIFKNEYLPKMAKRLERWYNVKIELDDDKRLNEIWFTGIIEMESFSEILELLKVTSHIDYTYNEKDRTIKIYYKSV